MITCITRVLKNKIVQGMDGLAPKDPSTLNSHNTTVKLYFAGRDGHRAIYKELPLCAGVSNDDLVIHDEMNNELLGHYMDAINNREKFEINAPFHHGYPVVEEEDTLPIRVAAFLITYQIKAPSFCIHVDALKIWLEKEVSLFKGVRKDWATTGLEELLVKEKAFFESGRKVHLFPQHSADEESDDLPDLVPCDSFSACH